MGFLGKNKLVFILLGTVVFVVFITVLFILQNLGGGSPCRSTLEFWVLYHDRQIFSDVFSSFQRIEQGIKINYRQFSYGDYEKALIDALAAGIGPDLVMIHHTWLAKHRDKLTPMPDSSGSKEIVYPTAIDFQKQFVDVAYQDLVFESKIYAVPLYVDTLAIFYNKDMLNIAGITTPPKNWEEFNKSVELLTKLDSSGNIIQAGAAIGTSENINRSTDILSALFLQGGTKMTNAGNTSATFTRHVNSVRVGENALQYYTDFANTKKSVYTWNDSRHYSIDAFIEGKVAMMLNYSHQIHVVRGRFDRLNFSIAPLPQFSELDAKNYANYFAVGVSNQSKNKAAAWRFLNFLASKDGSMTYVSQTNRPSARRDIIDLQRNDPQLGIFAVQALSAKSWFQIDNNSIDNIFADMVDDVNLGRASIRSALRAAESKINVLMTKLGQQ